MLYEHLLFKTGYRKKGTQKFLAVRGDYLGVEMIGSYHAPGSFEEQIVLKNDDPAKNQHPAVWAEFLYWKTTPLFSYQ